MPGETALVQRHSDGQTVHCTLTTQKKMVAAGNVPADSYTGSQQVVKQIITDLEYKFLGS